MYACIYREEWEWLKLGAPSARGEAERGGLRAARVVGIPERPGYAARGGQQDLLENQLEAGEEEREKGREIKSWRVQTAMTATCCFTKHTLFKFFSRIHKAHPENSCVPVHHQSGVVPTM
jgi:hypothetical protein